jgi:hypothetical protein
VTTFETRVDAVEALGFTRRQAAFLTLVALHSGYCLRRQYAAFAGIAYGKNVRTFLEALVARQLATRFVLRRDRGHLYHLHARTLYRLLHVEHSRNRRDASAALIARKLMVLDYVLGRSDVDWLATEDEKCDRFDRLGVPRTALPQYAGAAAERDHASTARLFPHKLPIAVVGEPPLVQFVALVTDTTGRGLAHFLDDHAALLRHLPAWAVIAVGPAASLRLAGCEAVFERFLASPVATLHTHLDDVRWYFRARQTVEANDVARLSLPDIDRFRRLRDRFAAPALDALYRRWRTSGDAVLMADPRPGPRGGRLVMAPLSFEYRQFGSLPGVA